MNNTTFSRAEGLYQAGDFSGALKKYTDCLKDTTQPLLSGEYGRLYHNIGNCLMKLKNPEQAIKAYTQAEADVDYTSGGALHTNLGKAYASLKDYDEAKIQYQAAIDDPYYDGKYKAYMALGNVELKLGESANAGKCFREAALDEGNPDPAKALLNLGVCFMSLNRPQDAIQSYASAFDFEMKPATRNKLNASMGQAYAANGQPQEAVDCFKEATLDGTFSLSDSAAVDYSRCISDLSRGVASSEETGIIEEGDLSGLDVTNADDIALQNSDPYYYDEGTSQLETVPGYVGAYENDEQFFTASEDEMKDIYKSMARKERKRKGWGLKILIVIIILIAIALGVGIVGYTQGYGYPTQRTVASSIFADPSTTNSNFSKNLSESSIKSILDGVVKDNNAEVTAIQRGMTESVAYVKAHTSEGGELNYKVSFVRDLVGWKVSNIELYFASANS